MRLSRGWHKLLLFWVGVVSFCGVAAGILQMLGSPGAEEASARGRQGDSTFVELASRVPLTPIAAAAPAPEPAVETPRPVEVAVAPEAPVAPPEPAKTIVAEAPAMVSRDESAPAVQVTAPVVQATASVVQATAYDGGSAIGRATTSAANDRVQQAAPQPERKLHLRIVRDSKLCPTTTCYKWHLINHRTTSPRAATIDLARLHLEPGLREATENGTVQLFIEAIERHKTVNGHDTVIFEATNLAGVMPSWVMP
jgi:hypothetical protein